ncbi:PREDICTED: uncharacterized protein LOC109590913, partial [Amphimedon queenslandica]|uniref:Uncharacterized protein n=1 Tax=Amphimedon queenslandica TaxID=400682 RepID=A0AAN0JYK9_AMPQE
FLTIFSERAFSGYILFQGKVSVSIDTIKKCKCCLLYKYYVSSLLLSDPKYHLEDLHYFDDAVSRVLKIPENFLYPETTFRQYDVPIYPRENIIYEVENRLDAVEQHLKEKFPGTSTYTLEPKFPATDCDMRNISLRLHLHKFKCELLKCSFVFSSSLIKELYEKIKLVYKQLYDITAQVEIVEYVYAKNKSFVADGNFRECLSDWIVDLAKKLESKSLSNYQSIIPGAVFCLLLSDFDIVENLPQDKLKLLIKLLYLKPDEEGHSAYRNLLSCLSNNDLKIELHRSVERLCRQFIKLIQGKSIDWLRNTPLPLYHFLRGISEPFVPIEMNLEMEWTFWQTIKDNKRSFHKYLQEKDS